MVVERGAGSRCRGGRSASSGAAGRGAQSMRAKSPPKRQNQGVSGILHTHTHVHTHLRPPKALHHSSLPLKIYESLPPLSGCLDADPMFLTRHLFLPHLLPYDLNCYLKLLPYSSPNPSRTATVTDRFRRACQIFLTRHIFLARNLFLPPLLPSPIVSPARRRACQIFRTRHIFLTSHLESLPPQPPAGPSAAASIVTNAAAGMHGGGKG